MCYCVQYICAMFDEDMLLAPNLAGGDPRSGWVSTLQLGLWIMSDEAFECDDRGDIQ